MTLQGLEVWIQEREVKVLKQMGKVQLVMAQSSTIIL